MNSRLISIIRKEFIQIFRDPRTLVLVIVMPMLQLFLLGYAATTDVKNISLAVWDQSQSPQSRALLDAFRAANYFSIDYSVYAQEEYTALIESGKIRAALIIPPNYEVRLLEGKAQVSLILDGSDATVGGTALSIAKLIGQSYATKVLAEQSALTSRPSAFNPPLDVRTQVWYNPDLIAAYFNVPGVIGMILYFITTLLTASSIVRERERGTIEQLIVTPIRSWELVVGKILPYTILAFIDIIEVLIIGHWWFKVPIRGDLGLIFALSGLFILSGLGIGLFASTIANTQQEAFITVMVTMLPSIFLSGFFFPIEAMPKFLQYVSALIPLRYYLVIIRALLLKGVGVQALQSPIIALTIFSIVIMGVAARRFRKRLD
ncbi:MAG TPA: ABC transporter permease [Anaerolineales bacterium]|nr:ABC transporter permease [Anaerolineales bacterium]